MTSKPFSEKKSQAIHQVSAPISARKLRFNNQMRHEMNLNLSQKASHQQIIKKKKTCMWIWNSRSGQKDHDLNMGSLTKAMKFQKNTHRFELSYQAYPQMPNQGLDCIAQTLKELPCLKILSLSFEDVEITDRGFYRLGKL